MQKLIIDRLVIMLVSTTILGLGLFFLFMACTLPVPPPKKLTPMQIKEIQQINALKAHLCNEKILNDCQG